MTWNEEKREFDDAGAARCGPELACLLFARDSEDAERQRLVLEEHGIFAHLGHACAGPVPASGLGIPLVVAPDDQERANMILACVEATGDEPWVDDEDQVDDADDFDDDDDDDDDFLPDDDDDDDDFEDDDDA